MKTPASLGNALNEAVVAQFMHLFSVYVKETSNKDEALKRFKAGLVNLAEAEQVVAELLDEKKD